TRSAWTRAPRRRLRHGLGPVGGRAHLVVAALHRALAGRRDLLDLGAALRRGPLSPWLPPHRRPDVRVRPATRPDHRGPGVRGGGHHALPLAHAPAGAGAYFRGLIDLPFDPHLHFGSLSFASHSIFSLAGMIGGRCDFSGIGIALGEAIARIGDVINGEHHAIACSGLPWCVRYTKPATLGQTEYVHSVAAYDGLVMVLIFIALVAYWRRVRGK